ncbi:ABC transporter permease [Imperialibacter roseus]|uniref:ABC transporter permease n=1 Tax=Imperialibacter roseus TaxID=1324217 RepID=A0ABZ0ISZ8_9BACT|nr:ABC transporter permease [Imperialibacter roseus]WOK07539.1 ABC transporter permease [Imperialibacter roseus]
MNAQPPKYPLRFLRWFCREDYLDEIEGDLIELFEKQAEKSPERAKRRFVWDVVKSFRLRNIRSFKRSQNSNNYGMYKSYFRIGWRNLWRNKLYSALNICGLTFGIACFLVIGLYVFDELTFDLQHGHADRIYRVIEQKSVKGEATTIAAGSYKLAEESRSSIPEVENTTRMMRQGRANLVDPENPVPFQETVTVADEHFLEVFDFPLSAGDERTALKEPNSIIINEDLARRIFNSTDVLGRNLQFSHRSSPLKITGIFKKHPTNSSFTFNNVMSESSFYNADFFKQTMAYDWASTSFSVYALLNPDADPGSVSEKMTRLVLSNATLEEGTKLSYSLQALKDMHLYSEGIVDGARNTNVESIAQGNPLYIKIFSFAALFSLLIAGINYTNLTTARASSRTKEVGVRKTVGAMRSHLITQFLIESLLMTSISFALAILIVNLLLPSFNHFVGKQLSLGISTDYWFWLTTISLVTTIGLASGTYGALLLSHFKPVSLLRKLSLQRKGDLSLRKGLVIFQFTISIVMVIGTIVLLLQVGYLNETNLGFNKDLLVVIDVNTGQARSNFETVKNEMAKVPSVRDVSVSSRVPGEWKTFRTIKIKNQGSTDDPLVSYMIGADKDFLRTFEIELADGRNFDTPLDSSSIIVNETAAKMLNITEAYGQVVDIPEVSRDGAFGPINDENKPFSPRIIGVVKDFHFQSLHEKIQPLILAYNQNPIHNIDYYSVRIAPTDIQGTLDKLKTIMVSNAAHDPFEYHFLAEQLALFYVEDERRQALLGWVALATIFIACLGLFGLATFATQQRVKEIGVRKVLGATVLNLVSLLSREFIKLVLIANVIALPIAWWAVNTWLQEYAYHLELKWWMFGLATASTIIIAVITISQQAIRTAVTNPVKSLRTE